MTNTCGDYIGDMPTDALVCALVCLKLTELDRELFHHLQGIKLRAFFYACCDKYAGNTEIWLRKYKDHEWPTDCRGPFPFDYMTWVCERLALEKRSSSN
jgi:hypothetical protein